MPILNWEVTALPLPDPDASLRDKAGYSLGDLPTLLTLSAEVPVIISPPSS